MKKSIYTDYCVCFSFQDEKGIGVQFYDDIKDRPIKTIHVDGLEEAKHIMEKYVAEAPDGIICQMIEGKEHGSIRQKRCWKAPADIGSERDHQGNCCDKNVREPEISKGRKG